MYKTPLTWRLGFRVDAVLRRKKVPEYRIKVIRSYLSDRSILVSGRKKSVTCGVPQGSVIGSALWNIFYDNLLELEISPGVQLVAYADDVAVVAREHTGPILEDMMNPALEAVNRWMNNNGLKMSPLKSEAVLLTRK